MWTRWTTRALRGGVAFGGGCTAVAIWQATSLQQHYLSKPRLKPHTGANSGLLVYHDDNDAAAAADATTSLPRFPHRWFWRSKQQPQPQPQQHEQQQRLGQHGAHDNNDEDEKEDRVVAKKMARILKDTLSDALRTIESKTEALLVRKPSTLLETARDTWARLRGGSGRIAPPRKKIRLIILGDSLVCGVGCEDGNVHRAAASPAAPSITGHVLPQIVARVLSLAMRADVEWCSAGLVGGTVADVRTTLLPEMRQKLTVTAVAAAAAAAAAATAAPATGKSASPSTPEEIVLVVICGLNDFKQIAIDFPYTTGPAAFKSELKHMLADIDAVGRDLNLQFKVFLPAIPFVCGRGDTSSPLMALRPLSTFIEGAAFLWDSQKESLASGSKHITFIEAPSMTSHYATPGIGNFASDGIHPSRSGYTWYALHIAERMLQELCVPSTAAAAGIDK